MRTCHYCADDKALQNHDPHSWCIRFISSSIALHRSERTFVLMRQTSTNLTRYTYKPDFLIAFQMSAKKQADNLYQEIIQSKLSPFDYNHEKQDALARKTEVYKRVKVKSLFSHKFIRSNSSIQNILVQEIIIQFI